MSILVWAVILVVALVGLGASIQSWRFARAVADAARRMLALRGEDPPRVSMEGVPEPVRRFAEAAGVTRRAPIGAMRLTHGGTFRPALDRPPMKIRGEQYFSGEVPGFVWWGRISMAPGVWVEARDSSIGGTGNMLVRLESTLTLADARGPAVDEASLLRLLAELVWYPTSLLDPRHVRWAAIDDTSAAATLRVGGREVRGTFRFGADELPTRFDAVRPYGDDGAPKPWFGEYSDYRDVGGVKLPFRAGVFWVLDGRPIEYAHWELERVELDRSDPY